MSVAGARRDLGVSVAEVNLKFIWDAVSEAQLGRAERVYVVDSQGRLIAYPDRSIVLGNTDVSGMPQIRAAFLGSGREVIAASDLRFQKGTPVSALIAAG